MGPEYPWYRLVRGTGLAQGHFLTECPVVVPVSAVAEEMQAHVVFYDVVVMSQSCDLAHGKLDLVLVCPFWGLQDMERRSDLLASRAGKEALRQGNMTGYHLLNRCDISGQETDCLVVDFRNVCGVPLDFLRSFAEAKGDRVRLLSPYKEHLSQGFARFFMRVGLPVDIPRFR